MDINAYHKYEPNLDSMLTRVFLDKMKYQKALMQPYTINPIIDTGAQANIIGDKHLAGMGIDVCSLHHTRVTMDIKGKRSLSGNFLLHREIVYLVEGDIIFLSETELKDLEIIPKNFPQVGQFGGTIETGNST